MANLDRVVAVDLGGTGLKAALVDRELRTSNVVRTPTERRGGIARPDQVVDVVAQLQAVGDQQGFRVRAAGLAVPGIVDDDLGLVRFSANLGWRNLAVRELVAASTHLPVAVGHDVRIGGLAEFRVGAAKEARNVLFVPIGTGIASAIFLDGQPFVAGGYAGEIGHIVVEPGGPKCGCGNRGCLETIASAAAVARRYNARSGSRVTGAIDVVERMADDSDARAVWAEAIEALAYALVIAITVLGPEVVVIGGGLAESGDVLLAPLRETLLKRLTFQRRPDVVLAALGDRAGYMGAGLLGWEQVGVTPKGVRR
ncbi:glucokinase [Herbihabitans rhizosphaerae]|uniref:Glucokinase n=1 Tax=Herbihabitans rhizosphaerae TaxID=1872711 RepID=A0A4Q7L5B3_9PSEU|nr:ROK family protein [Herbihabitans rhizosphaerae]RZS44838.1 glucokinase [Herbihabitans rhizosphaerae]